MHIVGREGGHDRGDELAACFAWFLRLAVVRQGMLSARRGALTERKERDDKKEKKKEK